MLPDKPINMYFSLVAFAAVHLSGVANPAETNPDGIFGQWKGIDVYQDRNSYDGHTIYLPNNEEIIIEKSMVRVYFYPYFKSDEFAASATAKSIVYTIGKKKVKSDYYFHGDTLVLSMNFINKTFIKMYERTAMNADVVAELDQFGFNPSELTEEFELDTLHKEFRKGFSSFDSLSFEPFRYIQFVGDQFIRLGKAEAIAFERGYQYVKYKLNGVEGYFKVHSMEGTQQFAIIPGSLCQCDSIILPYVAVGWANRIRQKLKDDQW